jgi:hypothetical protein
LLLGAVVLALLAVGAGLALRATLAAPPVAKTTSFTDATHHFRFQRPALWNVSAEPNGALLTDSDGTSTVRIEVAAPSNSDESATDAANAVATATPGLATAPAQQVAGQAWEQRSGQLTGNDGAVHEIADYITVHDGQVYIIECASPLASFDATNNLVFQPLLASFTFLPE